MHQFQGFARPRCAQGLDNAKTHAAAAVHGDSSRLVDHQQVFVLKNDRPLDQFHQAARGPSGFTAGVDSHRRQAHFIARLNAVFRVDSLAVDAYLALAQQPIDPAAGHGLEVAHEKIVNALAGLVGSYRTQGHGTLGSVRSGKIAGGDIHCCTGVRGSII